MTKKRIGFIVNPIAGIRGKETLYKDISTLLDLQKYDYVIEKTAYPSHATEIAKKLVREGNDIVVAVGGDGSVNEVAAGLIGSETALGILPLGSGNGFAGHLGLGRRLKFAMKVINEGHEALIDTCRMNDRPFVNLFGAGFDGLISYRLKQDNLRGFWGYLKNIIDHFFDYHAATYTIQIDGQLPFERKCYILEVANSTTFGYGFMIYPEARLNDNCIHVVAISDQPRWKYLSLFVYSIFGNIHKSPLIEVFNGQNIQIIPNREVPIHMDGEGEFFEGKINISIQPKSLKVIVPKDSIYLS